MSDSSIPIYIVDAFAPRPFSGNPAGVVLLDAWPPDAWLQAVAAEVNLSETAFLVGRELRWFTPRLEVALCGHATLAAAHVLVAHRAVDESPIVFTTRSGPLPVSIHESGYVLDFPMRDALRMDAPTAAIEKALNSPVREVLTSHDRYICLLDSAEAVAALRPDLAAIAALPLPGLVITAAGTDGVDFVSRYFAPAKGVPEDPVTGTSHCALAPLWGERLGKTTLRARQLSARGGEIDCSLAGERVLLSGRAITFSVGSMAPAPTSASH